jgi:hypothetical protein
MATLDDLSPERAAELSYIIEKTGVYDLEKRVGKLEEHAGISSPTPLVPESTATTNPRHEAYLKENEVVEPVDDINGAQPPEPEVKEEATVPEQKSFFE